MLELTQLVPQEIDFSILVSLFSVNEILFVNALMGVPTLAMCLFNKKACKDHGRLPVFIQCFSRVALDIALVAGIAGSAIGAAAMTLTFKSDGVFEEGVSIALLTMLWGGIFVGWGYFLHNTKVPIEPKISRVGLIASLVVMSCVCINQLMATEAPLFESYMPLSEALLPYVIVLGLCFLSLRFNGKPWVVSFTDANLLATMGGLGMGIVLWFTSGGGYCRLHK